MIRARYIFYWCGNAIKIFLCALAGFLLTTCNRNGNKNAMFEVLDADKTGLHFTNSLRSTHEFNKDGLIDLFFASNQGENKLYLNKGKLNFNDVTKEAQIPEDSAWSTGVSLVDINDDGLLDIYVCRVGNYKTLHSKNQLLVCQGIDKNGVPFLKKKKKRLA